MKVAIVYDRVNKIGGAERVLESVGEIFPKATLFTSVYNARKTPWAKKFKIKTSFLQKIPLINLRHEFIPYLMPLAFESLDFEKFDLVISITSEGAKGIIVRPKTQHVCICLTPTRYLWSGYQQYFKNIFFRFITKPIVYYLRKWDLIASGKPDSFIAISENVKERIRKYYKRESFVIYPPSDRLFTKKVKQIKIEEKDFFLVVSRLVDYKRVDLAVDACSRLNLPLVVIGDGSELERLQAIANDSVVFKGKVSDEELVSYYKNARALIFPGEEDFGITMVEAQYAGKPVIAFKKGGATEIVKEGVTGLFFNHQNVDSLIAVLKKFERFEYNSFNCKKNAKKFSDKNFKKNLLLYLKTNKYI